MQTPLLQKTQMHNFAIRRAKGAQAAVYAIAHLETATEETVELAASLLPDLDRLVKALQAERKI